MAGETGPISVSMPVAMVIAGFFGVAMYNTIEIVIWIFSIFKYWKGLYFWSLLVASFGIPVHSIAVLLRFFDLAPNLPMCVVTVIGWWTMVTGQSVVLYSRLHLVVRDARKIRWVLIMIVANVCILHIPVSILFLASNGGRQDLFLDAFNVYERIQLAGFSAQECIISGLYIWEAARGLKPILEIKGAEGKNTIRRLALLFLVVVLLDSSLMATEYSNHFQIQTTYKPVVYSVKLKIEFVILNKLLAFTRMSIHSRLYIESGPAGDFTNSCSRGAVSTGRTLQGDGGHHFSNTEMGPMNAPADHIFDGRFGSGIVPGVFVTAKSRSGRSPVARSPDTGHSIGKAGAVATSVGDDPHVHEIHARSHRESAGPQDCRMDSLGSIRPADPGHEGHVSGDGEPAIYPSRFCVGFGGRNGFLGREAYGHTGRNALPTTTIASRAARRGTL